MNLIISIILSAIFTTATMPAVTETEVINEPKPTPKVEKKIEVISTQEPTKIPKATEMPKINVEIREYPEGWTANITDNFSDNRCSVSYTGYNGEGTIHVNGFTDSDEYSFGVSNIGGNFEAAGGIGGDTQQRVGFQKSISKMTYEKWYKIIFNLKSKDKFPNIPKLYEILKND